MTSPPKNTSCGSPNIFGPINRYLFLGCSIVEFSASGGWNEQQSELTVKLVVDNCPPVPGHPKYYFDLNLQRQEWNGPDPGFFGLLFDIIGAPVYFRVDNFEFSGLIQSWQEQNDPSGGSTYTVKIVDPRILLQQTHLILNDYAGSVGSVYNLVNVYGFLESLGNSCPPVCQPAPGTFTLGACPPDGAIWGSPAFAFGGSNITDRGIEVNKIIQATSVLLSAHPAINNIFSPYGRIIYKAPSSLPPTGMGLYPETGLASYCVDLSDLPVAPTYWRISGTSISLLDLISQLTSDAGYDYYIELVPILFNGQIVKIIKVRTVDRFNAPILNGIETFIGAGRQVKNYSLGRELRTDTTQTFVIGGNTQTLVQSFNILPYIGSDGNNVIEPIPDGNGGWNFVVSTSTLPVVVPVSFVTINSKELEAARVSIDAWSSYASVNNTDLWNALNLNLKGIVDFLGLANLLKNILPNNNDVRPGALANKNAAKQRNNNPENEMEKMRLGYEWIKKFADTYATHFQVPVPFTCGYIDSESGKVITSDKPAKSGWTEHNTVLGLPNPGGVLEFFREDDRKISAFVVYRGVYNFPPDQYLVHTIDSDSYTYVFAQVKDEYEYLVRGSLYSPRVILSVPDKIDKNEENGGEPVDWGLLKKALEWINGNANAQQHIDKAKNKVGSTPFNFEYASIVLPLGACFGIESDALSYGPWAGVGAPGGIEIRQDTDLVPWQFGGYTVLGLAGAATAAEGITNQLINERGTITILGYPELPLGAELLAADAGGPFAGGTGPNLFENRIASLIAFGAFSYITTPIHIWNGTFGPNVTDLSVSVGDSGAETTYNIQTWTSKFGRFQKQNAERLKAFGKRLNHISEENRKLLKQTNEIFNAWLQGGALVSLPSPKDRGDQQRRKSKVLDQKTPHEAFVGQYGIWNNAWIRPWVVTESIFDIILETESEYFSKAIMSLDGLLRPISLAGSGGFPRLAIPLSTTNSLGRGAQPPVDKQDEGGMQRYYKTLIQSFHLNPFANPNSAVANRSDTPSVGHDIELLGRGLNKPSNFYLPEAGYINGGNLNFSDYASDYRAFALRGPLIVQGWGYDLDGFPIPNKADTEINASAGIFTKNNLQTKFMDGFLRKSHTWPVGPVDLRFDRDRGVWTVPQYRQVVSQLLEDIDPSGCGRAKLIDAPPLWDENGAPIDNPEIQTCDVVGNCYNSGEIVISYYDPANEKYNIIEKKDKISDEIFRFRLLECVCINFNHNPDNVARGMRQKWDPDTKTWQDDYEVLLRPLLIDPDHGIGPAPSGFFGWAKILHPPTVEKVSGFVGLDNACSGTTNTEYKDYHSTSGGAHVLYLEPVAEYIEFVTTTNIGCVLDFCFNQAQIGRIAKADPLRGWNGHLPDGDFIVRWSNADNLQCLQGYANCTGELVQYRGIAVLDKKLSSQAICYSEGCRDEQTCGKWVYNVIEWNRVPRVTRVVSGEIDDDFKDIPFYEMRIGSGLTVQRIDDCAILLEGIGGSGSGSGVEIVDTDCCTFNQRVASNAVLQAKRINFASGLRVYRDCISEGYSGTASGSGIYSVVGGITPVNTAHWSSDLTGVAEDGHFNKIYLQGGLQAADAADDCEVILKSGIKLRGGSGCFTADEPDENKLIYRIELWDGLKAQDIDPADGTAELAAGVHISTNDWCDAGQGAGATTHGNIPFANKLLLGAGLRISTSGQGNETDCHANIRAGVLVSKTTSNIDGSFNANTLASKMVFGPGTKVDTPDECTVRVSAGVNVLTENGCLGSQGSGYLGEGHVDPPITVTTFRFGRGLRIKNNALNQTVVQAGVFAGTKQNYYIDSDDPAYPSELITTLHAASGIRILVSGQDTCAALIGAGIKIVDNDCYCNPNTETCTTGTVLDFVSQLNVGRGLRLKDNGLGVGCINLAMPINGNESAILNFDPCFRVDYNANQITSTVSLAEGFISFGTMPPTGYYTKDEIYDIQIGWCVDPNGNCLINSIEVYKQRTHFNDCGQIIYIEDLGTYQLHPGDCSSGFPSCGTCCGGNTSEPDNAYVLQRCDNPSITATLEMGDTLTINQAVQFAGDPGICWKVTGTTYVENPDYLWTNVYIMSSNCNNCPYIYSRHVFRCSNNQLFAYVDDNDVPGASTNTVYVRVNNICGYTDPNAFEYKAPSQISPVQGIFNCCEECEGGSCDPGA